MDLALRATAGVLASGAVALFARRRGSLAPSGAWAAVGVGSTIYTAGGAAWFLVLLAFFVTSSALGRVGDARKAATKREFSKDDTRDALQVLANGGLAALLAAGFGLGGGPGFAAAFLGALGTACADTWATELGVLSRGQPVSLRTFRRVPRGQSGAVSLTGTLASAAGAALVGGIAACFVSDFTLSPLSAIAAGLGGGLIGAFADSWLGAILQSQFRCPHCDVPTEGALHHCGTPTQPVRGLAWLGNDGVNALATGAGAATGALLGLGFST